MTEKKYIITESQLRSIYLCCSNDTLTDFIKEKQQLKPVEPMMLEAENTRLKELLSQALSTLHGWAGIGTWIWPESALDTVKKDTSETITAIEKAGIK